MKRLVLLSTLFIALTGCSGIINHDISYYMPSERETQKTLNIQAFHDSLQNNGYWINGENKKTYNTPELSNIINVTPQSVKEVNPDIDYYCLSGIHCFLYYKDVVYRFDPGSVLCMFMWDYDDNGVADVFTYSHSGSGRLFHNVAFFDMTTLTINNVFIKDITDEYDFDGGNFIPSVKDGHLNIDSAVLSYNKETQEFTCGDLFTPAKATLAKAY